MVTHRFVSASEKLNLTRYYFSREKTRLTGTASLARALQNNKWQPYCYVKDMSDTIDRFVSAMEKSKSNNYDSKLFSSIVKYSTCIVYQLSFHNNIASCTCSGSKTQTMSLDLLYNVLVVSYAFTGYPCGDKV